VRISSSVFNFEERTFIGSQSFSKFVGLFLQAIILSSNFLILTLFSSDNPFSLSIKALNLIIPYFNDSISEFTSSYLELKAVFTASKISSKFLAEVVISLLVVYAAIL